MAKYALLMEKFICAQDVRSCRHDYELCMFAACVDSPVRAHGGFAKFDWPIYNLSSLEKLRAMLEFNTMCMRAGVLS